MGEKFLKNYIKSGDCISLMKEMPKESVDVIFADPPYNLLLPEKGLFRPDNSEVNGVRDDWDKFSSFSDYDDFTYLWLSEAKRILKPNGSLWVIGTYHNIFRIGKILQDLGFWILNDVIWCKTNPMPNFHGTRLANAHETLIWCVKSQDSKYKFNYKIAKNLNDQEIQMRSDWFLPICRGKERLHNENGKISHSTQKPECLLKRIILISSNKGDLVLDPFLGSGTTAAVCKMLSRDFIGFEKEEKYVEIAKKRVTESQLIDDELLPIDDYIKSLKVRFASLVEVGLILPGSVLFDKKNNKVKVRVDGILLKGNLSDTIHGMASKLVGRRINGWDYWFINIDGKIVSIDDLRNQFRRNYLL